jgi:hypothetical protein
MADERDERRDDGGEEPRDPVVVSGTDFAGTGKAPADVDPEGPTPEGTVGEEGGGGGPTYGGRPAEGSDER